MRHLLGVFLLVLFCAATLLQDHAVAGDAEIRFWILDRFWKTGELSDHAYSMIGPLLASPLYALGNTDAERLWWVARFNVVVWFVWLLAMSRAAGLARGPRSDRHLALLVAWCFCSMVGKHLQGFYMELVSCALVTYGALVGVNGRRWGWLLVGLGAANTPALVPPVFLGSAWLFWTRRDRESVWSCLSWMVAVSLVLMEAWLRRGSPFDLGYAGTNAPMQQRTWYLESTMSVFLGHPVAVGLPSVLLSFGKGVMWFAPGLWFWNRRYLEDEWTRYLLVVSVGMVGVYSCWAPWHGDWYWGPRYFLLAGIPAATMLVGALARLRMHGVGWHSRMVVYGVLALSAWVGLCGTTFGLRGMEVCMNRDFPLYHLCWYTVDYSALYRPPVEAFRAGLDAWQSGLLALWCAAALWLAGTSVSGTRIVGAAEAQPMG